MEHITLPGEACFTLSEAKKLAERINKLGSVKVNGIRGVWMHYVRLKHPDRDAVKVSSQTCRYLRSSVNADF